MANVITVMMNFSCDLHSIYFAACPKMSHINVLTAFGGVFANNQVNLPEKIPIRRYS